MPATTEQLIDLVQLATVSERFRDAVTGAAPSNRGVKAPDDVEVDLSESDIEKLKSVVIAIRAAGIPVSSDYPTKNSRGIPTTYWITSNNCVTGHFPP